ncbi:MAG TPA: M1 family aminopeptidase [Puia sp.]|jgi:aminopeptidase N|nr:M1 family aminopeptidase [Puia sp.]
MHRINFLFFLPAMWLGFAREGICQGVGPGVPYSLAVYRSAVLRDIRYSLDFRLPAERESPVRGEEKLSFRLDSAWSGEAVLLDFRTPDKTAESLRINGVSADARCINEHLVLPAGLLHKGLNTVAVDFTAGDPALNRNREYLYTLLVPDRARTLFPCFDQPDLKAVFELTLVAPAGWAVMANAPVLDSMALGDSCRWRFRPSNRISTYLFSFVAGKWSSAVRIVDGRPMRFLYRETDSTKIRLSLDSIFRIEGQALRFMEEYTGIRYPFQKFDFVAIPDFQFGGMEHVGAIQYKASSLFLDSGATREQLIGRSNLLSHETEHMWFGDLVTMRWFNDVWMKEVFANFMADKIGNVTLPDGKYELKFLTDHYPAAYSIDRTEGTHPIRQELDNLQEAGSLYGNIIYHKAPIVMRQLEALMGAEAFRNGLRDYLRDYAGGNASWPDLIRALQRYTKIDLHNWNEVWVNGAGRPVFSYDCGINRKSRRITSFTIHQKGEDGSDRVWPQLFSVALVYADRMEQLMVRMNDSAVRLDPAIGKDLPVFVILDADGRGYGLFPPSSIYMRRADDSAFYKTSPVFRAALYVNRYESRLADTVSSPGISNVDLDLVRREPEELNLNLLLDEMTSIWWRFESPTMRTPLAPILESTYWGTMRHAHSDNAKKLLFRAYSNIVLTRAGQDTLFTIWKEQRPPVGVKLSEDDYTNLAAALAIREYPGWRDILKEQLGRIHNPDRRERWLFLQPALSNDTAERDGFFAMLHDPQVRKKEAWVLAGLSYLHHPLRTGYSEKYLPATLELLEDIQRTGDVFFPQSWLQTSLSYYRTASAAAIVRVFLQTHPNYNPRLKAKILQAADNLLFRRTIVR